jgi:uncharacterized membrane protein (UPF0127 family)
VRLLNKTKNIVLSESVEKADSMFSRMKGLLGRSSFEKNKSLHIANCNSIHTCFMKFPIDAVFVDKNMKVKFISQDIKPWNVVLPVLGAKSVFEFAAGAISEINISVGDQLDVGH